MLHVLLSLSLRSPLSPQPELEEFLIPLSVMHYAISDFPLTIHTMTDSGHPSPPVRQNMKIGDLDILDDSIIPLARFKRIIRPLSYDRERRFPLNQCAIIIIFDEECSLRDGFDFCCKFKSLAILFQKSK